MNSKLVAIMLATGAVAFSGSAMAGDAAAGEAKAEACLECHEPAEDFEGQSADEIAAKIKSVKMGQVKHKEKISPSDEDIADIAAFFASGK